MLAERSSFAPAYWSGTTTLGSSARTEVCNWLGSTFLRPAHSTRLIGRYVGSARHRSNTLASIVSLTLVSVTIFSNMWFGADGAIESTRNQRVKSLAE